MNAQFRNAALFTLPSTITIDPVQLQSKLSAHSFVPCAEGEFNSFGWQEALKGGVTLVHEFNGLFLVSAKFEEKILPLTVVQSEYEARIAKADHHLSKEELATLKAQVVADQLPESYSRYSVIYGLIMPAHGIIAVSSINEKKAQRLITLLAQSIDGLTMQDYPTKQTPSQVMTRWVAKEQLPKGFIVLDEAELREPRKNGAVIRCKNQDLYNDEIKYHIEQGKRVTELELTCLVDGGDVSFILDEPFSLKTLDYSKEIDKGGLTAQCVAFNGLLTQLLPELNSDLVIEFDSDNDIDPISRSTRAFVA